MMPASPAAVASPRSARGCASPAIPAGEIKNYPLALRPLEEESRKASKLTGKLVSWPRNCVRVSTCSTSTRILGRKRIWLNADRFMPSA